MKRYDQWINQTPTFLPSPLACMQVSERGEYVRYQDALEYADQQTKKFNKELQAAYAATIEDCERLRMKARHAEEKAFQMAAGWVSSDTMLPDEHALLKAAYADLKRILSAESDENVRLKAVEATAEADRRAMTETIKAGVEKINEQADEITRLHKLCDQEHNIANAMTEKYHAERVKVTNLEDQLKVAEDKRKKAYGCGYDSGLKEGKQSNNTTQLTQSAQELITILREHLCGTEQNLSIRRTVKLTFNFTDKLCFIIRLITDKED